MGAAFLNVGCYFKNCNFREAKVGDLRMKDSVTFDYCDFTGVDPEGLREFKQRAQDHEDNNIEGKFIMVAFRNCIGATSSLSR